MVVSLSKFKGIRLVVSGSMSLPHLQFEDLRLVDLRDQYSCFESAKCR